jgi:hypothetical protein
MRNAFVADHLVLIKNASVFSLNAATFSYSGACEQSSK